MSARAVEKRTTRGAVRKLSLFNEHLYLQWINHEWAAVLTPSEYKIVMAVATRSICWGKWREVITLTHFTSGITPRAPGAPKHYNGTGLSRPTVIRTLQRLLDEGYLYRVQIGNTWAYGINVRAIATDKDPCRARKAESTAARKAKLAMQREKREALIRAQALWRDTGSKEAREAFMALCNGENIDVFPSRRKDKENSDLQASASNAALPQYIEHTPSKNLTGLLEVAPEGAGEKPLFPEARKRTRSPRVTPDYSPAVRQRREDRGTLRGVGDEDVIRFAREEAPLITDPEGGHRVQAALASLPEETPVVGTSLAAIVRTNAAALAARARARNRAKAPTHELMETAWRSGIAANTEGALPPMWGAKRWYHLRHQIKAIPLPAPEMNWGEVIRWVSGFWGEAVSLSVPFMLKQDGKRNEILRNLPSIGLFLAMSEHFIAAYARLFHGEGFTPEDEQRARVDRFTHEKWMRRRGAVAANGTDAVPVDTKTDTELEAFVQELARNNERAQEVLKDRAELSDKVVQLRRLHGRGYKKVLERQIAKARADEAFANMEQVAAELGVRPAMSEDDYYNEGLA